ncbi:hypothetical protein MMC17_006256 [Xylographa soralifera]|nr:hypothetical protein [Xylographa soralifera]
MSQSSCLCGNLRLSFTGDAVMKFRCHCLDDRKITGSLHSTNLVLPEDGVKVIHGTPKTYALNAESGATMTSYFCGDCGSTLYRKSSGIPGVTIIKVGCIDDLNALEEFKPDTELYVKHRVAWLPEIPGAAQLQGMM